MVSTTACCRFMNLLANRPYIIRLDAISAARTNPAGSPFIPWASLPKAGVPKRIAPNDTNCGPPAVAPRAKLFVQFRARWEQKDPALYPSPSQPTLDCLFEIVPPPCPKLRHLAAREFSANIPPAI